VPDAGAALAVCADPDGDPARQASAEVLAARLQLPLLARWPDPGQTGPLPLAILAVAADGLALRQVGVRPPGPLRVDFAAPTLRYRRRAGHNELLGRAVGIAGRPGLAVIDATAGLGRDAFVLADLGAQVELCEREPVLAALLEDALRRAAGSDDPWLRDCVARMVLHPVPAEQRLLAGPAADVVYLDPMFPERTKSAAVGRDLALLQRLLPGGDDGAELARCALASGCARVVVKRPLRAVPLLPRPHHDVRGKAVRFDVYEVRPLPARQPARPV
jgi:16S rRNA (guanine1516-N2)-methyltransferase